ncbi:MarR family transcriptional regulator [Candidatus Woesearchaeota archaeon]|nr:MarR family transcriptional regulator [Candidatus Woesearchaeota archaeon]
MKTKGIGIVILGMAILMLSLVIMFNRALTQIVNTSCSHGDTCPMWGTLDFYTNLSLGLIIAIILIGLFLVFLKDNSVLNRLFNTEKLKSHKPLSLEESQIIKLITESNGSIFQSEIVEKTNMPKVKISRILDRLEGHGLIERKRRGMTNMVLLKH